MPHESFTADTRPPPNRLSIGHLLAWLSLTAVEFAVHASDMSHVGALEDVTEEIYGPETAAAILFLWRLGIVLNWCVLPFFALGLVGLLLWPWRAWKATGSFPREPGHWLLIAVGAAASLDMLPILFMHFVLNMDEVEWLSIEGFHCTLYVLFGLISISPAVVLLIGLGRDANTTFWKICLGLLAIGLLVRGAADFTTAMYDLPLKIVSRYLVTLGGGTTLVSLILVGVACIVDQRRSVPRDLFHGLGVIAATAVIFNRLIAWAINLTV